MNKAEEFLSHLSKLKTEGNIELIESIAEGFKTLVEYRVEGSSSEKLVDIMESDDSFEAKADAAVKVADTKDEQLAEQSSLEEGLDNPGLSLPSEEPSYNVPDAPMNESTVEEVVMEAGEGIVRGQLSAGLLKKIDSLINEKIQKMSGMIDKNKLVKDEDEKLKYLKNMRSNLWREQLVDHDINPSQVSGLIPSLTESIDDSNAKLETFLENAFKIFDIEE